MKQIAYLGWLGAGNLGDDGCYQLFRQRVHSISNNIACIPITIHESERALFARRIDAGRRAREPWRPEAYDYVVLGGGSLLNADRYIQALACAQAAGVPTAIWGSGFDGLPHGLVPQLLRGEGSPGDGCGPATAPDAPASDAPVPSASALSDSAADVIRACRVAGVRGPVTAAWLRANGCPPIAVSGDPGLLLDPLPPGAAPTPAATQSLASTRAPADSPQHTPATTRRQIAVIWGMSHRATHESTNHDALTRAVATWLKNIANRYRPVICAMWSHDAPYAKQLATLVGEGAELREEPLALDAFRALAGQSAALLSYRLHGCIFSAACRTPFCSIAYRSKCFDFAHSIGAGAWVVEPGGHDFKDRLDHWLEHVSGKGEATAREQLARNTLRHRESLMGMLQAITLELKEGP